MNPMNPILPIIIANNGSHVHSELGAICLVAGFAAVILVVAVVAVRFTILDIIDNRARKIRNDVFMQMRLENDPVLARDWQLFRAELERRISVKRGK